MRGGDRVVTYIIEDEKLLLLTVDGILPKLAGMSNDMFDPLLEAVVSNVVLLLVLLLLLSPSRFRTATMKSAPKTSTATTMPIAVPNFWFPSLLAVAMFC